MATIANLEELEVDRGHISKEKFDSLYQKNMTISSKLMSLFNTSSTPN